MANRGGINRVLEAADSWASAGHKGFQRTMGALNVGRITVEEATKRALEDIVILANAGDQVAKTVVRHVLLQTQGADEYIKQAINNLGSVDEVKNRLTNQGYDAEALTQKIVSAKNAQPILGPRGRRMAMLGLAGLGGIGAIGGTAALVNAANSEER